MTIYNENDFVYSDYKSNSWSLYKTVTVQRTKKKVKTTDVGPLEKIPILFWGTRTYLLPQILLSIRYNMYTKWKVNKMGQNKMGLYYQCCFVI